ncbi:MAG: DNA methyltransferase [Anaerolineae bacterium]
MQLILALKAQGWRWTRRYIWHKKNPMPGKWPNRFKNAWERLLQFNKQRQFRCIRGSHGTGGSQHQAKFRRPTAKDHQRVYSSTGRASTLCGLIFLNRRWVYPSNVLHMAVESGNQGHSAVFPQALPAYWYIRLFTQPGDLVLDPFMGSGTTSSGTALGKCDWD